jgi:hypothetical protein
MPQTETRRTITESDPNVTTTVAGADGDEVIFDLSPPAGVYYRLYSEDHPKIQSASDGPLRLRLTLTQDGSSTEIGGDATVTLIGQDATEEGETQIGPDYPYSVFKNADQYSNEDVIRLTQLPEGKRSVKFPEASHLKIKVDNSGNGNDIDLSETDASVELEVFRGTE